MKQSHEYYLERCIEVSKHSREAGNTPFGALLVDAEGNILMETGECRNFNTQSNRTCGDSS